MAKENLSPTGSRGGLGLSDLLDRFRNFQTNSLYASSDKSVKGKPAGLMVKFPSHANRNGHLDVAFSHPSITLQPRKAGASVLTRTWLKFETDGDMRVYLARKQHIIRDTGVNARDLRILEAALAPASILVRDRALVVNVENIKLILTCDNTYILVKTDDTATYTEPLRSFVEGMKTRSAPNAAQPRMGMPIARSSVDLKRNKAGYGNEDTRFARKSNNGYSTDDFHHNLAKNKKQDQSGYYSDSDVKDWNEGRKEFKRCEEFRRPTGEDLNQPTTTEFYEFRVLELVLDVVSNFLEQKADELDKSARKSVKSLTQKVTAHLLERVRKAKGDMTQLSSRVKQVKQELEHLLEDDAEMDEMYLSRKNMSESPRGTPKNTRLGRTGSVFPEQYIGQDQYDVDELEDLLETFNESVNGVYNKLHALSEHIDDTEDFINLLQDSHRNKLIQLDLVMTALTFSVSLVAMIYSLFGMNLSSGLEEEPNSFVQVVVISSVLAAMTFLVFIVYTRKQMLL
eukprot:CAMPEP_0198202740 /NCGR_PEP_ID=MMETSP1445-20131203/5950_1 /TAXON_ID=36898 /ORGANISM="Pyramimonas sp., Strain CCMP2087" /LENGTH=511 /DNA_ID=CAMNT_0043873813 /DNA_START=314 /DNA_END=1849 /DNA_ORIENTATION=-